MTAERYVVAYRVNQDRLRTHLPTRTVKVCARRFPLFSKSRTRSFRKSCFTPKKPPLSNVKTFWGAVAFALNAEFFVYFYKKWRMVFGIFNKLFLNY